MREVLSLRLPEKKISEIDKLVSRFRFHSRTEFIEEALRQYINELKETRVVTVRPFTLEQAKKAMFDYLNKKPGAYVSDVAFDLGIDIELAFKAAEELSGESKIRRSRGSY